MAGILKEPISLLQRTEKMSLRLLPLPLKEILAPALENGDVLVLDNLSVHKVKGVLDPLFEKGVKVWFLPPYSPDFNPIENAWSKIKSILKKLKAYTFDALKSALSLALNSISLDDILSWLNHYGYILQ
ncbi:MAG: transposase [Oscillospiraceae bacterium]|nr:transposase [Oscillospiraceae bacterium]